MSAWSRQRKISIIATLAVLVIFMVSGVVFKIFYRTPSCDDGVQNGSEKGVDCGGVCPDLCATPPLALRDVWRRAFPITDGVYAMVAYIENQNKTRYVPAVQFEVELYDSSGALIGRASKKTPIMPNGITPIFVPHILTGRQETATASFRFVEEPKFAEQPYPYGFDIKNIYRETEEGSTPYIRADAINVGASTVRETDFVVILYDEEGTAVAASRTFEENIRPEEKRVIQFTWAHPITLRKGVCPGGQCVKQVERIEIIPVIREW